MGLARQVGRLPLTALSLGLEAWERSAGMRQFARRRGNEALQIAAHTPLGRLLPKLVLDDGADEEAAEIAAAVRPAASTKPTRTTKPAQGATKPAQATMPAQATEPAPATEPTRAAEPVRAARAAQAARDVGAPGAVADEVEHIVDQLEIAEPDTRADLPIPDFDNITLGSLRARLRNLSLEQLATLREWEQAHAHRLPVLTTLDNRIAKLGATEAEAYPRDQGDSPAPTRPA